MAIKYSISVTAEAGDNRVAIIGSALSGDGSNFAVFNFQTLNRFAE